MSARRYELSDFEWSVMQPLLPNKPRGVARADDRKVLTAFTGVCGRGRLWPIFRSGTDLPRPAPTAFDAGRRSVCGTAFEAVSKAYDGDLQMIDSSSIRVHQHGGNGKKGGRAPRLPPLGTTLEPSAWGVRAAA